MRISDWSSDVCSSDLVIEAPSQLLEEWVWDYDTLKRFATNAAGEPIPAALVEKMNSSRRFAEAFGTMTQLGYANASLAFYSGVPEGRDLAQVYDAIGRAPCGERGCTYV